MNRLFLAVLAFVGSLATGTINAAPVSVHASQSATFNFSIPAVEYPLVLTGINFVPRVTGFDSGDAGTWAWYSEVNGTRTELYSQSDISDVFAGLPLSKWDGGVFSAILTITSGEISVDPYVQPSLFYSSGLCHFLGESIPCLHPILNVEIISPSSVSMVSEPNAISILGLGLFLLGVSRMKAGSSRRST